MKNLSDHMTYDFINPHFFVTLKREINKNGFYLIEEGFSKKFCEEMIKFVKNQSTSTLNSANITTQYAGSEIRIWDSEKKNELIFNTKSFFDNIYTKIFDQKYEAYTVLAMQNKPIDSSSLINGRWHIDSFRKQFKVFIYLTDVSYENGPFEFFPETTSFWFKLEMLITGKYFAIKEFLSIKKSRRYESLKDQWINNVVRSRYKSKVVTCKAGTILFANTSSVHRAIPCIKGERITLTCYY